MTTAYCTLNDVKLYGGLGVQSDGSIIATRDDTLLTDALDPYSRAVDNETQWAWYSRVITNELYLHSSDNIGRVSMDNDLNWWLKTNSPAVQSVASIQFKVNFTSEWTSIDSKYFILIPADDSLPPSASRSYRIGIASDFTTLGAYRSIPVYFQVTYTGGYVTIPPLISRVTKEWVWFDYKIREHMPTAAAGFIGMPMTVIKPQRIPPHLAQLLNAWKRTAVY